MHKLIELRRIIEEKIGSLNEEVEIGTNVKLNPLYIADRKDEIEFVRWTAAIINSILNRNDKQKYYTDYTHLNRKLQLLHEYINLSKPEHNSIISLSRTFNFCV